MYWYKHVFQQRTVDESDLARALSLAFKNLTYGIISQYSFSPPHPFLYIRTVKKGKGTELDFEVDFLTNSIRNTISGDSFQTEILALTKIDLKQLTKKNGWQFNWKMELNDNTKEVYKLTIVHNPSIIQGLISFTINADHIYMDLLESAPFNLGQSKLYEGVAGNLVAYACRASFQHGFEGYVSFTAKTKLIEHYQKTLNAVSVGGQLMIINTVAANLLVDKYFKNV